MQLRSAGRGLRVALYSHDAQGLGHVRRNLAIAAALRGLDPTPDVLLLAGASEAAALPRPPGCDIITLPGMAKDGDGRYRARSLGLPLADLTGLRAAVALASLAAFEPDVLIVDKHPRGAHGELEPALTALRGMGLTRVVLGLRDVLDEPVTARREWRSGRVEAALRRWYDQVWVYGDPRVHDLVEDLCLPPWLRARVVHTGYLAPQAGPPTARADRVVCMVGAGDDGGALLRAFAAAPLPAGLDALLVTGPHLPAVDREAVARLAARRPQLRVLDFVAGADELLDNAAAVVMMGGYNSLVEAVAHRLPALVVPRIRPRREQLVRAEAFERLGLVDVLHPAALTADRIGGWVAEAVTRRPAPTAAVDLRGLARLPGLVRGLIRPAAGSPNQEGVTARVAV